MGNFLLLISALFYGISLGMLAYFLISAMTKVEIAGNAVSDEVKNRFPVLIRLMIPLLPNVRPLAANQVFHTAREAIAPKLWMAGYGDNITPVDFIGLRILFTLSGMIIVTLGVARGYAMPGFIAGLLMTIYPGAWLNTRIAKRHMEILRALPNLLDLLTLSVEAGKDFMSSLRDILHRRKMDALGEEWMRTFQEIQLGRKRTDALRDLAHRVRQPDLTSVVNAIIQAEELEVSIGQLLRIQGDMLRNKRFSLAEKLANEAPVKIILPIVLFIFPAVMLILLIPLGMKVFALL
jgi:tight adherence protein C